MPNYLVISGEQSYVEPVLDDGSGPTEYYHDICYVINAKDKAEAKRTALWNWRRLGYQGYDDRYDNPFRDMTVQKLFFPNHYDITDQDTVVIK